MLWGKVFQIKNLNQTVAFLPIAKALNLKRNEYIGKVCIKENINLNFIQISKSFGICEAWKIYYFKQLSDCLHYQESSHDWKLDRKPALRAKFGSSTVD